VKAPHSKGDIDVNVPKGDVDIDGKVKGDAKVKLPKEKGDVTSMPKQKAK